METTNCYYTDATTHSYNTAASYPGNVVIPATVEYEGNVYTVKRIGYSTFRNCTSTTSVTIPNGVTFIKNAAFHNSSVKVVRIPATVTYIDTNAFAKCPQMTDVYLNWPDPSVCGISNEDNGFFGGTTDKSKITLYVPAGTADIYKAADYWKLFGKILPVGGNASGSSYPSDYDYGDEKNWD